MIDLLETVIDAHGGLERWTQLDAVEHSSADLFRRHRDIDLPHAAITFALPGFETIEIAPGRRPAADGQSLPEPLIVSIDASDVAFT